MTERVISSPCTGICQINPETRLCLGCHRAIDEIAGWARLDESERQRIMQVELPERAKTNRPRRRGGRARLADRRG